MSSRMPSMPAQLTLAAHLLLWGFPHAVVALVATTALLERRREHGP